MLKQKSASVQRVTALNVLVQITESFVIPHVTAHQQHAQGIGQNAVFVTPTTNALRVVIVNNLCVANAPLMVFA